MVDAFVCMLAFKLLPLKCLFWFLWKDAVSGRCVCFDLGSFYTFEGILVSIWFVSVLYVCDACDL